MRMKICSCLLTLVLACNATAELIHEAVEEKSSVSLRCPHSVEGTVTWSRENDGSKVDVLTAGGDQDIRHIHDPQRRYSSLVDKSLHIRRVNVSDSGRYFCNSEAAVELTVIPAGTSRLHATEGTEVTLTCPPHVGGSHNVKWSSTNAVEIQYRNGFYVSSVDPTLTITHVELVHSGLYYCDETPAVYLNVTKGKTTTRQTAAATTVPSTTPPTIKDTTKRHQDTTKTSSTTTSTTRQTATTPSVTNSNNSINKTTTESTFKTSTTARTLTTVTNTNEKPPPGLVYGVVVSFLFLLIIIIIVYFTRRCRIKRQGSAERCLVYEEIQDGSVLQPTDVGPNHNDHMYSTISDLPRVEKKSETTLPNDSTYSSIGNPFIGGNNKGPSHDPDNIYFLLEKPKAPGNNTDQHL
ncbi:uncharacterized protein LOC129097728 [Anoplopoma fimbria]|uniref:uncharacterized protein LOC129097728 n=1 Tax=Anoplopoma fimbria TaxID=229290 RepID=UPI0023EB5BDC|nr:uncharacterized protein LOC129097728 [Anoplopoma fimbria]